MNQVNMNKFFLLIILIPIVSCSTLNENDNLDSLSKIETHLQKEIELKRKKMESVSKIDYIPEANLLTIDSTIISTKEFEGKLLVIEFWATWNKHCFKEKSQFRNLKGKYENDNVKFISISVDSEFSYWKNFITKNKGKANNYWYGMKESESLFSLLYIELEIENMNRINADLINPIIVGIPKYLVIAPDGKILNNQNIVPSDPIFEIKLNKFIKKHAT